MIQNDYAERVYAGILGKMIGVYLGRPFEGWTYERITAELGDVRYYVNDHATADLRHRKLIVTDDDLAGTFVFFRALADNGFTPTLTSEQIGNAWLNYIVKRRTVLWWGGMGTSTEQTVYARLREGIPAPRSGSIETNGKVLAEQIGAQIFIDAWALANPGDPERAAYFARQAARVSHDGVAVEAAVLIAAMEALAFGESDVDSLLDGGLALVSKGSDLHALIGTIRDWHAADADWRRTRARIAEAYGYDKFSGICHIVPNHALVIMSLLHGGLDFSRSMEIVCTSGWDTDCNAGNVGCLVGIAGGLKTLDAGPDWREPLADRLYLSSAEGGRAITDAVIETHQIVQAAYALAGGTSPDITKSARFNFAFPGSVQGFARSADDAATPALVTVSNVAGHGGTGERSLAIGFERLGSDEASVVTRTFALPEDFDMRSYDLLCSPTLYPGQTVEMRVECAAGNGGNIQVSPCCHVFGHGDSVSVLTGPSILLAPGEGRVVRWKIPPTGGNPILDVGLALKSETAAVSGTVHLDYLRWEGAPDMVLRRPEGGGTMWQRAWAVDATAFGGNLEAFRISQDRGRGMAIQGSREWRDYAVSCDLVPHLGRAWGLAARVQGRLRYYAVLFEAEAGRPGLGGASARLVRMRDRETTLASVNFPWPLDRSCRVELKVNGGRVEAWVDGELLLEATDAGPDALDCGAIALLCEQGAWSTEEIAIVGV